MSERDKQIEQERKGVVELLLKKNGTDTQTTRR